MKPSLWIVAGVVATLTTANVTAQPGGGFGGGFDPATFQDPANIQQMIANAQQAMAQMDPSEVQQMAATFDPFVAQMDPEQFKQAFQQSQQQMQEMAKMEPAQFQQMLDQAQQQMQAFDQGGDPSQFQPGRIASLREQMGITNDTEWSVVEERIQKVREAQRAVQGDTPAPSVMPINTGTNYFGRSFSGFQGRQDQAGGSGGMSVTGTETVTVQRAIENRAPPEETKAAIDRLVEARKTHRATLQKAEASLREVLTVRQEAVATINGLL